MVADRPALGSVVLAAGIALGGLLAGFGLARVRAADRYVTVKGISERRVAALRRHEAPGRPGHARRYELAGEEERGRPSQ